MSAGKSKIVFKIMKIIVVFGTRPEAIKIAPLIKELKKYPKRFDTIVCLSAQHRDMADQVLNSFGFSVDYDLNIMSDNQKINKIIYLALKGLEKIFIKEKPDVVIIQGDTTTSFSAALAAYYQGILVFHVEAGLRTYQRFSPFPEEINRQLITRLSNFHFAPTKQAKNNLIKEGVSRKDIIVTGNTVIDSLAMALKYLKSRKKSNSQTVAFNKRKKLVIVTLHRREKFGKELISICKALKELIKIYPEIEIIFPVHPNPNVKLTVKKIFKNVSRVKLASPLNYFDFVSLLSKAYLIITDSGGIQEEAASLGKPVLICRDFTERPEIVEAGLGILVGSDKEKIIAVFKKLMNKKYYSRLSKPLKVYGDGHASRIIVNKIKQLKYAKNN